MANEGTKEKLDIVLEAPADFTSPEVLYQDLINTLSLIHISLTAVAFISQKKWVYYSDEEGR